MNRSVVIRMFVVEFRFAAARILHDGETERQRDREAEGYKDGGTERETQRSIPFSLLLSFSPSLFPSFFIAACALIEAA
jgi:hypothetical protein